MSRPPRPTSSSPLDCSGGVFDWDVALRKLDELNARVEDPTLWDRPSEAQAVSRERANLAAKVEAVQSIERDVKDALEYAELAEMESDEDTLNDARAQLKAIKERAARAELEALLSGEADGNDAYIEINSGAGGTESCDWAGILLRMYTRWANAHGMTTELVEETDGDQAGIKSATLLVKGANAYGWLKTEAGVHRLVRISPYDSSARRHTSFASAWVYPVIDDTIEIDINPSDVRTDTYRASGAGGQHINKTDSAVRVVHLPTGIVAECQDGRSQHSNKAKALQVLQARIQEKERSERAAKEAALRKGLIGSGDRSDRIRTYNFPQGRLTDHRINLTLYKLLYVMEGDLGDVLQALQHAREAEQLEELELSAV